MSAPTTTRPGSTDDGVRAKTLRGLLLARELDAARHTRGLTTRVLASRASMSAAMLNRVMTGRRVPTALEIGGICSLLEIRPDRRRVIYQIRDDADLTDWIVGPDPQRKAEDDPVRHIEDISESITWFESNLIPRPLRTTAYHQAVTRDTSEQHNPTSAHALRISLFLLHAQTLNHTGVPGEVWREQVQHLLTNHVGRIRLLPTTVAPQPGFRVLHIDHFPPVVHIEHHSTTVLLEGPASTTTHTTFLRNAKAESLTADATRQTLAELVAAGGLG